MTRPFPARRIALAFLAGSACVAAWLLADVPSHAPLHSPGTPPGIALSPATGDAAAALPWEDVAFRHGLVSTSHPLATQAGVDVLAQGGNAIDAAVAVQLVLGVVEPQTTGLGGGGFLMVYLARERRTVAIDGREAAPAAATPDQFQLSGLAGRERDDAVSSAGLAVGIPGSLAAFDMARQRFGTMRLADTLAPAIRAAENGIRVDHELAARIADDHGRTDLQPETAALFRPRGVPLKEGDLLVQPELAKTLRAIARDGTRAFYGGDIGRAIVEAQRRVPASQRLDGAGRMTQQDLADYRAIERPPVHLEYRGWTVASAPLPSDGMSLIQMLKLVRRFPLGDAQQGFGLGGPATRQVAAGAVRLGRADRAMWMGDADFAHVPVVGLLDAGYIAARSSLITPDSRGAGPGMGNPLAYELQGRRDASPRLPIAASETQRPSNASSFSIVDRWGNVVSATTGLGSPWGSGILVPGHGFLLNNALADFNLDPLFDANAGNPGADDVAPRKRPRSTMVPTLVLKNGRAVLAYGASGEVGADATFDTTLNLIDHGMSIQQAAGAGHGSMQGLAIDLRSGLRYGGAEPRHGGTVLGDESQRWAAR